MELNTPKRIKTLTIATSPPSNEIPYNWQGDDFLNNCHSPENEINNFGSANGYENRENKRGRPRSGNKINN